MSNLTNPRSFTRQEENSYKPLPLPKKGEDLKEDRQYILDPVARAIIVDVYGIQPPREIVCLSRKYSARTIKTITTYHETQEVVTHEHVDEGRPPLFRAFMELNRIQRFSLDIEKIESLKPFYVDSPKVKDFEEKKKTHKPRSNKVTAKGVIDLSLLGAL